MDSSAKQQTDQARFAESQAQARLRLSGLVGFLEEHDGKHLTAWECDFIESVDLQRVVQPSSFVFSERQQEALESIYTRLGDKELL